MQVSEATQTQLAFECKHSNIAPLLPTCFGRRALRNECEEEAHVES